MVHSGDATPGVCVPGLHMVHFVEFSALANFPIGQAKQVGDFTTPEYRPGTHASQLTDPNRLAEKPAGQSLQTLPPEIPEN